MKLSKSAVIVSVMSMALAASATPTLLLNGDFELPVEPPNTFLPVGSVIPGWTVIGSGGVNVDHVSTGTSYWPGNTSQFMDLTGNTGGGGILSSAFATVVGQTYQISFDAFNGSLVYPGTAYTGPVLSLQASGGPLVNFDGTTDLPAGTPEVLTYSFTAASSSTTLTFMDTSGTDSNAGWIDNVAIQAVPEPAPGVIAAAFLLPFGLMFLRNLRRKRVA